MKNSEKDTEELYSYQIIYGMGGRNNLNRFLKYTIRINELHRETKQETFDFLRDEFNKIVRYKRLGGGIEFKLKEWYGDGLTLDGMITDNTREEVSESGESVLEEGRRLIGIYSNDKPKLEDEFKKYFDGVLGEDSGQHKLKLIEFFLKHLHLLKSKI